MLLVFIAIGAVICIPLVIYIFTRPSVPKKYPIFTLANTIEDHYTGIISQLRSAASDSLALYNSYNMEAFTQLVQSIQGKLEQVRKELDGFDLYWKRFERFKAQASFVLTCKSYSQARRSQVRSAQHFLSDAIPFVQITDELRRLQQTAHNLIVTLQNPESFERISALNTQTAETHKRLESIQPHHPITTQYRQYILGFLKDQQLQLDACFQITPSDTSRLLSVYNEYTDTWSRFNDSHVIDLVNDEFSWQIDAYEQAMQELQRQTDYNS